MDNLLHDIEEDIRHDSLINFFKTYGKHILAGLAVIIIGSASFSYWHHYNEQKHLKESDAYFKAMLLATQGHRSESLNQLKAISTAGGTYASFADLKRAALLIETKQNQQLNDADKAEAIKILQELSSNLRIDTKIRHLASLLLILSTFDQQDPQKLTAQLGKISIGSNPWTSLVSELNALLHFKVSDFKQAESLYQNIANTSSVSDTLRFRTKAMLDRIKLRM